MRSHIVLGLLVAMFVVGTTSTALADPWARGERGRQGASAAAGNSGGSASPGEDAGTSSSLRTGGSDGVGVPVSRTIPCDYDLLPPGDPVRPEAGAGQVHVRVQCEGASQPWWALAPDPAIAAAGGGAAPPVVIDPVVLMQEARSQLVLPAPAVGMSPQPPVMQIAQLESWLWIDRSQWVVYSATASAGAVSATVSAVPVRVVWDMGNGDQVVCDGPGTVYEERWADAPHMSDCQYTYRHSSAGQPDESFLVTTTVVWELSWSATGAPGGGPLGPVPMATVTPVRVGELQALIQ